MSQVEFSLSELIGICNAYDKTRAERQFLYLIGFNRFSDNLDVSPGSLRFGLIKVVRTF